MAKLTFEVMCVKLLKKENFSFARYGDGEWACILGDPGGNCDGHPYYRDLGLALELTLLRRQISYCGMQPKATADMGKRIAEWMKYRDCQIDWCDADVIHDASIAGRLPELYSALRGRKVILVGPKHLAPIAMKLRAHHIETSSKYPVWREWTTIYADLVGELDLNAVVLYCASMATEVLLDKAAREYGEAITQIDVGSAFDPMCGVVTRRYHKAIIEREAT